MSNQKAHSRDQYVTEVPFTPANAYAHTQQAVDTVFSLPQASGANVVLVQALDQNIRYTLDGTTPTTTLGFRLTAGNDPIEIATVKGRTDLRFISETAGAILQYQYGE